MTRYVPTHRRPRQVGAVAVAAAVIAGGLIPFVTGGVAAAADPLPGPAVVGPTDAGTLAKEVVLDWAPVSGAKGYAVQVGTDDQWSDAPTLSLRTVASRLTLPVVLPHAAYVWRVAALGTDGQGRWSGNGTFTRGWNAAATPLTPADGSAVGPEVGRPTFSWTPVATASEYQLQVSSSPFFDAPFRTTALDRTEACFTTRTSVTPFTGQANAKNDGAGECVFTLLGTGETRYWRVRPLDHAVDGAAEVDTTPIVDEGINSQPPQAERGSLDTSACGTPPASTSPSPSASPSASASAAPSAAPASASCEPAHTVEKGPWSATTTFTSTSPAAAPDTDGRFRRLPAIDRPALSSDVCTAGACRDFPVVSWPAVAGASRYRLYVALDAAYSNVQAIIESSALRWTPTDQWRDRNAGQAFYVVVQPCTDAGCGAVGVPTVFRKSSPRLATTAPADAALLGRATDDVVLSWQSASGASAAANGGPASSEAYAYHLQVARPADPDFVGTLVDDVTVDSTSYVSAKAALTDGSYLWRVQTVDASGHRLPWSVTRTFTRDTTAPTFSATPTVKLAIRGSVRVGFSEPVTGVDASSVRLVGVASTQVLSADGRVVTLTPTSQLVPGSALRVAVTAAVRDLAGNPVLARSLPVSVDPLVDDRSSALVLAGTWQRLTATNAVARTWSRSVPLPTRQTAATVVLVGRGAEVKGCVGPANGMLELWVDGLRVSRLDTFRTYSGCGVVLARTPFRTGLGLHRVQLRGVGAKSVRSKGTAVGIDAVTALP